MWDTLGKRGEPQGTPISAQTGHGDSGSQSPKGATQACTQWCKHAAVGMQSTFPPKHRSCCMRNLPAGVNTKKAIWRCCVVLTTAAAERPAGCLAAHQGHVAMQFCLRKHQNQATQGMAGDAVDMGSTRRRITPARLLQVQASQDTRAGGQKEMHTPAARIICALSQPLALTTALSVAVRPAKWHTTQPISEA